jgi:hypothetical protein
MPVVIYSKLFFAHISMRECGIENLDCRSRHLLWIGKVKVLQALIYERVMSCGLKNVRVVCLYA